MTNVSAFWRYAIGLISIMLSVLLAILIVIVLIQFEPSQLNDEMFPTMVLGMLVPFTLFFGVIAYLALSPQPEHREELMSVRGWRILALILLVLGGISVVLGSWYSIFIPAVMAFLCLMNDEKFREIAGYFWIFPWP